MNKTTKIWLNYLAGGAISMFLLWNIYGYVVRQTAAVGPAIRAHMGYNIYLLLCIALMFANTSLEGMRWFILTRSVAPINYRKAFASYLAGAAFSIITPNRIGEYPGRILYMGRENTFRYINVSVLSIVAQLWCVYLFGLGGLIYYNFVFPGHMAEVALGLCLLANVIAGIAYWRFESWLPAMEKIRWLKKFAVYGRLLHRVTRGRQMAVLGISMLRFLIFTAQYLFLLKWMNIDIPPWDGFWMATLFFWILAVVPSIALTELAVRGQAGIFLFQHFSTDTVGILTATTCLWLLNLVVPSVIGSILILRMRLLN